MHPARFSIPILILLCVACGAASEDDIIGAGGGSSTLSASFIPDDPNPGDLTTSMAEQSVSGDTVVVQVNVTGTQNVFSATLDVTFPAGSVEYLGHAPGDLFETLSGQAPVYLATPANGTVILGITSTAGAVDVSGTRALVRLTFRALDEGPFGMSFANMALNDDQVQAIGGISWSGGTLMAE